MTSTSWKVIGVAGAALACISLGYYQRDYYAVKAAQARAEERCKAWADEGGSYTVFRDATFAQMPLR